MNIKNNICELIGSTPLMEAKNYMRVSDINNTTVLVKLECMNPAGSAKDRAALEMIIDAEEKGLIGKGAVIIEPTSGNTGIGIAAVCAQRGYKAMIVLPDSMSRERMDMLRAYGAELVLTPGALGMSGAIAKAEEIKKNTENSIILGQFTNPANALAHYKTTGPEIYKDSDGKIDAFVAGVGTGGTITGIGRYLKEKNPAIKIIAVEPESSPLLSKGYSGSHKLQGIGANFVPEILDTKIIDEIITVSDEDAYSEGKTFARSEGIIVGITSGASLYAAKTLSVRNEYANKTIAVLLPDSGDRYLSSGMFD